MTTALGVENESTLVLNERGIRGLVKQDQAKWVAGCNRCLIPMAKIDTQHKISLHMNYGVIICDHHRAAWWLDG